MSALLKRALLCGAIGLSLTACGGSDNNDGNSDGSGIQSPPVLPPAGTGVTVNTAAAWQQYLTTPRRWEISGQQNGNAYNLALVLTPGPISTFPFNGQLASTTTQSLRLTFAGVVNADTEGTLYHTNNRLIGIVGGSGSNARCAVIRTPFTPLPDNSSVGASGTIISLDSMAGCSPNAARVGTVTLTWSVEQDLAVTLFCLSTLRQDSAGVPAGSETACVQSNAAGELAGGARLTLRRTDGTEISGKNY
ncbi:MAG: hypothetical protein JWP59_4161 [Massilia sp.]|jgi:hypothetical protein|nr:hypothetical protein [Massilia sp.]